MRRFVSLVLSLMLMAACQSPSSTSNLAGRNPVKSAGAPPKARASATPAGVTAPRSRVVPQQGQAIQLAGLVRLIAQPGATLISNNGGSLISDQGGSLLSDQGGSLISNNGGNLVSNNGGGMLGKTKFYGLRQAAPLGVYGLTDARITLHDASEQPLVDENGKPLTATTGPDGRYTLSAVLPPGNLIARIQLWNGGVLRALVTPAGRGQVTLDINTASSMGAAYVLKKFVGGQQAVLDKLPASENERLTREFDAVRGYVKAAFKHDDNLLNEATDVLRTRVAGVDRVIEDVKALLLGQAGLGRGLKAIEVPLAGPVHLTWLREGRLAFGEELLGRIRTLKGDGTLEVVLDKTHGRIKNNAPTLTSLVESSDGSLFAVAAKAQRVYRFSLDGEIQPWLGSGLPGRDAPRDPLTMACTPRSLAVGSDGTLWVGEQDGAGLSQLRPRLLALRPDRRVEAYPLPQTSSGDVASLVVASGPEVDLLLTRREEPGSLWRFRDGAFTEVASKLATHRDSGLCRAADGTIYLSETGQRRLLRLTATGALEEAVRFQRGPRLPGPLTAGPDGMVYVSDLSTHVVWAGKPGGDWQPVAGTAAVFQRGETQAFAINSPMAVTADDQSRIYIAETGGNSIKRFDGKELTVIVGGDPTSAADRGMGGPAQLARLKGPQGLAWHRGALFIADEGHQHLLRVGSDLTIQTLLSGGELDGATAMAFDATGRLCWPRAMRGTITRFDLQQPIETIAGVSQSGAMGAKLAGVLGTPASDPSQLFMALPMGVALSPRGELHFTDSIGCRIYKLKGESGQAPTVEVVAGIGLAASLKRLEETPGAPPPVQEGIQALDCALSIPVGLAFDAKGNLYVTEGGDRNIEAMAPLAGRELPIDPALLPGRPPRVRKITPEGVVTTVAGPGGKFFQDAEGEDALFVPFGITVTPDGRLVFTDIGSNLVRILPAGSF
ncbi:MAG: hypothetical protein VKP62_14205 [Candidatus Sericytochromatia bacterium]|nr:hypothetical protein [Candidatus Sericytochromatia bacterium]